MSPAAIIALMLVAGAFHACWNLVAKSVIVDRYIFLVTVTTCTGIVLLPWAFLHLPSTSVLGPAVGYVLVRGLTDAIYIFALSRCYQSLDLSLAYPLVRGIGPLVATLLAVVLLGERPALVGLIGIAVSSIAIGSMAWTGRASRDRALAGSTQPPSPARTIGGGPFWIGLTGLMIGSYTVIDKAAMVYWDPVSYLCFVELVAAVILGTPTLLRGHRLAVVETVRHHYLAVIGCAVCVSVSYVLALVALKHAYASYVAPLREVSVLFGVFMGIVILKEKRARRRIPSAFGILLGLALVGLAL